MNTPRDEMVPDDIHGKLLRAICALNPSCGTCPLRSRDANHFCLTTKENKGPAHARIRGVS